MFNAAKGSFLKNKSTQANWNLEFIQTSKKLIIEKSTLKLEKSTINLSGALQFLLQVGILVSGFNPISLTTRRDLQL
jgi:hypothetical protein